MLAALALTAGLALLPVATEQTAGQAADKVTFTVAFNSDVDSLNPFLGVEATSYELWAITYDYLVNYSMKDMSPEPGLAKTWDTSADGKTWTFHVRDGVKWSDGKPLTASDVAFTYNRVLGGGVEASNWSSYLNEVTKVTAPDAQTVVLQLSKPNAVLPLLPIPIVPEHVWKNISEKQMKSYAAEPKDGKPVVGSGPFRLVEGTAGGSTFRFVKNPDYWNGTPHVDEVDYRVYKSNDPAVQALIKGEVDYVYDITALQVRALKGREGITAHEGNSPCSRRSGSTPVRWTPRPASRWATATRRSRTRSSATRSGYAVDTARLVKSAFQGAATPGSTVVPDAYTNYHWKPPASEALTFDLDKAGQLLDEAGYKKGADGKRTMPDGSPLGTLRLFGRSRAEVLGRHRGLLQGVAGRPRHRLQGDRDGQQQAGRPDPARRVRRLRVGLVRRAGPGRHPRRLHLRPAGRALGLVVLRLGVRRDVQAAERRDGRRRTRVDIVKQMQQKLYQDSPYIVTVYTTHGRGGPERPVRLLPAAARPRRCLAGAVRRAQLLASSGPPPTRATATVSPPR